MSGKQLPLFQYCGYCKKRLRVSKEEHFKICPKFLGSFEEQYEGNTKLDPTTERAKTHIETVRKTLLDLEENDDIGIFACGDVMAHFPTFFSDEDKNRVHFLMMKRLPYCTDFFVENRRLKIKHNIGLSYNISIQMWFLDNGGW